MSDIAYILFGPKTARSLSVSRKEPSPYPPSAAHNISEPSLIVRSVASTAPKTPRPSARTAGSTLITEIVASPSAHHPSNGSRASTPPKPSLRAELFSGGLNPASSRQPSSHGNSWSQPKHLADSGASWTPPTAGYTNARSPSLSTLTRCSSSSSLNSVKHILRTPSETPAQLNMTLTAHFTPPSDLLTEKSSGVTASMSEAAFSASLLPYLNSPTLDGKFGAAERGPREALKIIPPLIKPPTAPVPPVPGSRPSSPIEGSKTMISSLTPSLGVTGTSTTTTYIPSTPIVPPGLENSPSLRIPIRNRSPASVDDFHNPKQAPLPLSSSSSPSATRAESSPSFVAPSTATSPSPFTGKYRHLPHLSTTEVAGTLAGEVEKKSMQQAPMGTPTIASTVSVTVSDFWFPLPPTHTPLGPAKIVQGARQRSHEPITKSSAPYVPIDRGDRGVSLVAPGFPPPPSTGPPRDPRTWHQPPAIATAASRRLKRLRAPASTATPHESFLPSFDDMEEQPSNTIPRLAGANRERTRTSITVMS